MGPARSHLRKRPELTITAWQAGGRLAGATQVSRLSSASDGVGLEIFFDDEVRCYQAAEAATTTDVRGAQLDVFALTAIAYRLVAGVPAATSADELRTAVRNGGLNLDVVVDNCCQTYASGRSTNCATFTRSNEPSITASMTGVAEPAPAFVPRARDWEDASGR